MEPAGSHPWSYAYNRIVPSASTSSADEFQHPHLATITAAAGQSAQSLLLQAAHAGFNSANSFVSPSPIASYNPVFSQIYHHAAAASNAQPKPAHYATNNVSAPHRQAHIAAIEKSEQQNSFQQNQSPSNVPNYYGENSSSSGASPSPTTSAITSTSLSWNSPSQFIAIQQQQQQLQQQQIQQLNEKTEDVKPVSVATKKTPRKRQPKKTVTNESDFPIQSPQTTMQDSHTNGENYYEFNRWQINDQQQTVQNSEQKIQNVIQVPSYTNTNNVNSQPSNSLPQPAHVQSSQSHSSNQSHLSSYYPAFPQQISSQYAACMSQQHTPSLYNLVPHSNNHQHNINIQQRNSDQSSPTPSTVSSNKVIVPNIEEELRFLSETDPKKILAAHRNNKKLTSGNSETTNTVFPSHNDKKTTQKCGFMDSYLKFLQGDRDESPSPNNLKAGRKINYKSSIVNNSSQAKRKTSTSSLPAVNENSMESVHKVQILSDKQILPKKRQITNTNPQPQISSNPSENMEHLQQLQSQQLHPQVQHLTHQSQTQNASQVSPITHRPQQYSNINEDFPCRETSKRTSKVRKPPNINDECDNSSGDSESDPVWIPPNTVIEDEPIGNDSNGKLLIEGKHIKISNMKNKDFDGRGRNSSSSSLLNLSSSDNFKTGDFIVLKSDLVNDWPTIWQVDSKCILQKYEPYCQNGKMFYRNMSKYASWNLDTKKLYVRAPIRIQIQSHTETIVEFMRTELLADDTEQFIEKIMEEYLAFRDHFEIYIQSMLSQSLDSSFFAEITNENDHYFLNSIRTIDDVMINCKQKLLSITPWTRIIILSIETWPQCHVFTDWGHNHENQKHCGGCHQPGTSVRFLLFGQPYDNSTMQQNNSDPRISYEKDIIFCRICAARADIFHKIAHEKYNLYVTCSHKVAEQQREYPTKSNTEILNDLLAESNWIDELFRNIRNSWAEVESLERQKRFLEVSQ